MPIITILSGKGGVGKTTLAASLSVLFNENDNNNISIDTDVDAPNLLLIMKGKEIESRNTYSSEKAFLNVEKCNGCKLCYEHCKYDAIEWDNDTNIPKIDRLLCEGCGICEIVCPEKAIEIRPVKSGVIKYLETEYGFPAISGELEIGEGSSGKIVSEAKQFGSEIANKRNKDIIIVDGPPGIGCPVISSASGSNYIILISEPTPAAIHDVSRALNIAKYFCNSIGLVINKSDLNDKFRMELEEFAKENNIDFLGTIPLDKMVPNSITKGIPIIKYAPDSPASQAIKEIFKNLKKKLILMKNA